MKKRITEIDEFTKVLLENVKEYEKSIDEIMEKIHEIQEEKFILKNKYCKGDIVVYDKELYKFEDFIYGRNGKIKEIVLRKIFSNFSIKLPAYFKNKVKKYEP